jgi:DNA-directed RNA polymerase specialized sigma24 family protein
LFLRAEALGYRDIAKTLNISLGSVAKSLARTMTRLTNADEARSMFARIAISPTGDPAEIDGELNATV